MDAEDGGSIDDNLGSATQAVSGWHSLSQTARNQAIVNETMNWYEGQWGDTCKKWVQLYVVPNTSSLSGLIPLNGSNACYWQPGSYVVGRSGYIGSAMPGEIIQMDLGGNNPHTAVVIANGSTSVTFKESNWNLDNKVRTRTVSHSTFYTQVSCFTIYYVL